MHTSRLSIRNGKCRTSANPNAGHRETVIAVSQPVGNLNFQASSDGANFFSKMNFRLTVDAVCTTRRCAPAPSKDAKSQAETFRNRVRNGRNIPDL